MRDANAVGLAVSCNTQINRLSMPHLAGILEVIGYLGAQSWQYQLTVPMGRASDQPELLVQPYDMLEVVPLMARLKARANELGILMWTGNNVGYFGPHEADLRAIGDRSWGGSCGAGIASIGIEADGTVKGCPSLTTKDWGAGNVRDAPLEAIWERSKRMHYTRDRGVADLWGFCATCYYADECRAGCTWTAEATFGRPGNNPFCHHRALELRRLGVRERVVRVEEAPGEPFDKGLFALVEEPWP
jgi:radical SAM protein with 4Fe4S-binding SPASM domain